MSDDTSRPPLPGYAIGPDEGVPGRDPEVRASAASTGGSVAIYRSVVDGAGPPPHTHRREDETIHVLAGTVEADCDGETWRVPAGGTVFLPRGRRHSFRSVDGPAEILFVVTPGHLDEFFVRREQATSPTEVAELARAYGF